MKKPDDISGSVTIFSTQKNGSKGFSVCTQLNKNSCRAKVKFL